MGALQCGVTVRATASQERQWFSEMRADRLALGDLRARSVLAFVDADMESWFRLPLAWRLVAPAPRRVLGVSFGAAPSRIDRVDPRTLRVVGEDLVSPALLTLRQGARPLRVGDAVTIGGVRVVVEHEGKRQAGSSGGGGRKGHGPASAAAAVEAGGLRRK